MAATVNLEREYGRQWEPNGWGAVKHFDDLVRYRLLIERSQPEVIVETGTATGGSARFFAALGLEVITVDIHGYIDGWDDPAVTYLRGSSVAPHIVEEVAQLTEGRRTMVSLDSDHSTAHVLAELERYAPLVTPGCYCVVEDGVVSYYNPGCEEGSPRDAALAYFTGRHGWQHDADLEHILPVTMHPDGWWQRCAT